jgi:hypothetical protein
MSGAVQCTLSCTQEDRQCPSRIFHIFMTSMSFRPMGGGIPALFSVATGPKLRPQNSKTSKTLKHPISLSFKYNLWSDAGRPPENKKLCFLLWPAHLRILALAPYSLPAHHKSLSSRPTTPSCTNLLFVCEPTHPYVNLPATTIN